MNTPKWKQDLNEIAASGHDLAAATAFYKRHGMQLGRHPKHGWTITAVLATGRVNDAAFWHRIIGSAANLIDLLDAPSILLAELAQKQKQAEA